MEKDYKSGNFHNQEVFLCTDNAVAERTFYKGNSKSPLLFSLILRLRRLQMKANFKSHLIHVACSRMIEQGTDGLSRGILYEGLLGARYNFLHYLPLDKSSMERSPMIRNWLKTWLPSYAEILTPNDWFEKGHDISNWNKGDDNLWRPIIKSEFWVWDPPPAAAYKAAEQIRIARHKRQSSVHLFMCPRLLTSMWRGQLHKSADLVMEIPPNTTFWNKNQHEPLVLAIYLPTFRHQPWFCKGTVYLESFRHQARTHFLEGGNASKLFRLMLRNTGDLLTADADKITTLLNSVFSKY